MTRRSSAAVTGSSTSSWVLLPASTAGDPSKSPRPIPTRSPMACRSSRCRIHSPTDLVTAEIPSQSVTAYPMQTKNGQIHQFNVSMERQVGDIGLRLSYIGSRNRNMNYGIGTNLPEPSLIPFTDDRRPYPQFVDTSVYRTNGAQNYDSMSFEANRRVGWVMFDAHWTWAHAMDNTLNTRESIRPAGLEPRFLRQAPGGSSTPYGSCRSGRESDMAAVSPLWRIRSSADGA